MAPLGVVEQHAAGEDIGPRFTQFAQIWWWMRSRLTSWK